MVDRRRVNFNKCESSAQRGAMAMLSRSEPIPQKGGRRSYSYTYYVRNHINTLKSLRIHELPKSTVESNMCRGAVVSLFLSLFLFLIRTDSGTSGYVHRADSSAFLRQTPCLPRTRIGSPILVAL